MPSPSILLQYLVPQHLLSRLTGLLARCRWRWFKNWGIRRLIRVHHVNLSEAVSSHLEDYPCFNSFFTRKLQPALRPIANEPDLIACPVDGRISQIGLIHDTTLIQAKKFDYSLSSLLAGDEEWAEKFRGGVFATLYLAPGDYHRVHMPCDGHLRKTLYVPGRLFSVNPLTVSHVPRLFARNERLVCLFDSAAGPMAVILVGAMLVGQMQMVWSETPEKARTLSIHHPSGITLRKGEELGHFLMGSTVIVLFGKERVRWDTQLAEEGRVRFGEPMGKLCETPLSV